MTIELENIVEALIFASPEGASTKEINRCIRGAVATAREADGELAPEHITRHAGVTEEDVVAAIGRLNDHYNETGRAFMLMERPAGWRIVSRLDFAVWVRELFPDKKPSRLTPSALETLAIIAYRQPLTKSSMEAVRGVSVDGPLQTLLDRNVVRIAGRADLPGRPLLYETTDLFFEHFGIKTVDDLPNASELRSVKLPEPEPEPVPEAPVEQQTELSLDTPADEAAAPAESGAEPESSEKPAAAPKKPRKKRAKKEDDERPLLGRDATPAMPTRGAEPAGEDTAESAEADDAPQEDSVIEIE